MLFSLYNSTTGKPADIISNGILDGFDALIHIPTLHLLYNSLHSFIGIIFKFLHSNSNVAGILEPYKYICTSGFIAFNIFKAFNPI